MPSDNVVDDYDNPPRRATKKEETDADDPWDTLCIDPHASYLEQGRMEGSQAGRDSGYQAGYDMGRVTAVDVGLELGFIQGIVSSLTAGNGDASSSSSSSTTMSQRAERTIRELQDLISDFPTVDQVFREQERERQRELADEEVDDSERPSDSRSVRVEIQRIRAKFKLLTVQLGCPHLSLKQVMDDAADTLEVHTADGDGEGNNNQTSEW
ncbi:hypothetical protein MPSEU_000833400 [Mayamaea pseudoterrestris]|nr:hypothetical protein MPSEU_000833400 [Mayamaea pseudoterrestris]